MQSGQSKDQPLWLWSRMSSVRWEDAWEERLRFLPPGCCAFLSVPGSRALRIRAYTDAATGRRLVRYFGGSLRRLAKREWSREIDRERAPLRIRGKLVVFPEEPQWKSHLAAGDRPPGIHIPASMAFGTGSHATTAGCLRLLADQARLREGSVWRLADLGTGSGILAIAAAKLGAAAVEALDYDPVCIRTAKANARANRVRLARCENTNVTAWQPAHRFEVITANLFSDILVAAAGTIAKALSPGGALIFSGVLREQFGEVRAAFHRSGLRVESFNPRGKWVAGLCH